METFRGERANNAHHKEKKDREKNGLKSGPDSQNLDFRINNEKRSSTYGE